MLLMSQQFFIIATTPAITITIVITIFANAIITCHPSHAVTTLDNVTKICHPSYALTNFVNVTTSCFKFALHTIMDKSAYSLQICMVMFHNAYCDVQCKFKTS